jgi:phosphoserine phosphatase RsbU/P
MEWQPGHLLLVDDNEMNRDMLSRRLKRLGHTVAMAEDGRQALDLLHLTSFDLVLLDVMMPAMNGYEVLEYLKNDDQLRHLPVIMISALTEMESVVRCIELGAEDYLPKPFDPVLLKARVDASLEKKRLRDKEHLYTRSLERDLEIGRQIQAGFLPETIPQPGGWEIAAVFEAARQVSGDFYDVFSLDDRGTTAIVVADICDKGVGAALFMALFRTLIRAVTDERYGLGNVYIPDSPQMQPADRLRNVLTLTNNYIAQTHGSANMFATIFFAILETQSGQLTYSNAGHEAPLLIRHDGLCEELTPTGPAVGMLPGVEFDVRQVTLHPGDRLIAYTDGVTEARDLQGGFYGPEKLYELCQDTSISVTSLLKLIQESLITYANGGEPADDVTICAVKRLHVDDLN